MTTYIKVGVIVVAALIAAYLYASMSHYKAAYQVEKQNAATLMNVNKENAATIADLKARLDKADETCAIRIKEKQSLINKLQDIKNLGKETNEKVDASRRDMLDFLNSMCAPDSGTK